MRYFVRNAIRTGLIGAFVILMLFGCASVNEKVEEMEVGQKYEASKSWFKEKWNTVGSKFSSSGDEETVAESQEQDPNKNFPGENDTIQHQPDDFEHTVRWRGESLSLIAQWYTGRFENWKALAQTNPNLNPNRIMVGNLIYIPREMMNTKEPLPRKVAAKSLKNYFAHTVRQPGEKLTAIAGWYTGNIGNFKVLAKANPDIDPDFLLVGNEIFIPAELLKTRRPLHQKSIQVSAPEPAQKPAESKAAAAAPSVPKQKKIQLFGPKQFPAH
jgi:hypothetical protein